MKKITALLIASTVFVAGLNVYGLAQAAGKKARDRAMVNTADTIYRFTVRTIDGKEKSLADYSGRILLIVNVASKCGHTPQYKGLEELYEKYRSKNFMILAFPSNDFLGQEPGTAREIRAFCDTNYHVTFDLFDKIHVKENPKAPLYMYLTSQKGFEGDISWNFTKFLVGKDGKVIARWKPDVKPTDEKILQAVEKAL